jgi:hypothetical protein
MVLRWGLIFVEGQSDAHLSFAEVTTELLFVDFIFVLGFHF